MSRKRRAQPGNRNAFKHGFYSGQFSSFERRNVSDIRSADLSSEIALLRVYINRFLAEYNASREKMDYAGHLAVFRALTLAVGRLASLERIHSAASRKLAEYKKSSRQMEKLLDAIGLGRLADLLDLDWSAHAFDSSFDDRASLDVTPAFPSEEQQETLFSVSAAFLPHLKPCRIRSFSFRATNPLFLFHAAASPRSFFSMWLSPRSLLLHQASLPPSNLDYRSSPTVFIFPKGGL
jgi:hypothetical protein